ncbi:MAG: glycoside hydrolase family 10 protein [Phycisphaerales bacterium]
MFATLKLLLAATMFLGAPALAQPQWQQASATRAQSLAPPEPPHEFRGVWIASVQNIDWPSASDLTVEKQKAEIIRAVDGLEKMNINAVLLQVRPSADALYAGALEPWSEYLTGASGISPSEAGYDPLRIWIDECHARSIDVHVWINPFRARHYKARSPDAKAHIARTNPKIVKSYDNYEWLDPGEPEAVEHTMRVTLDIVNRYNIDGVAIDDYFYPYPKAGSGFPDEESYAKYAAKMRADAPPGTAVRPISRDLWRQRNINNFVERFYTDIKKVKPYVLVGIAPFGIWKPGNPEGIKGMDAVATLHADARLWLVNGWLDYISPQLYWPLDSVEQNFIRLLAWWASQNTMERHLWPSLYTSRIGLDPDDPAHNWIPREILTQVNVIREHSGNPGLPAPGQIHFSLKVLLENRGGINQVLQDRYPTAALIPESPWLADPAFAKVDWNVLIASDAARTSLAWMPWEFPLMPSRWVLQVRRAGQWTTTLLPGTRGGTTFDTAGADAIALTPISRVGTAGIVKMWELPQPSAK